MKILLLGLNYTPEPVGIGPYTSGMAEALSAAGHEVAVVTGRPYYPHWEVDPSYNRGVYRRTQEGGVEIIRCPIYVPRRPSGPLRLLHHASFAVAAAAPMLQLALSMRPDVIFAVAPSLLSAPVGRLAARLSGAKFWLHIQDFEVEAAFATRLLDSDSVTGRLASAFELAALQADRVSTISPQMAQKLVEKGIDPAKVVEFRNWANVDSIRPSDEASPFRAEWRISSPHVALYSGNIANKQGVEIIIGAAKKLAHRQDVTFVICGNGPGKERIRAGAQRLENLRLYDLQPAERLSDLLNLATVHLLPQIASAADLVLPSKLANMLASGRPVVATAGSGTGLASEIQGCGIVVEPGSVDAFSAGIERLLDCPEERLRLGREARRRAEEHWSMSGIIKKLTSDLAICALE